MSVDTKEIVYQALDGSDVKLTSDLIRSALTKGNTQVSPREVFLFAKLCEARKLNPFVGEAHLVKYGDKDAQLVVAKDYWVNRLKAQPDYEWHKAGILIAREDNGKIVVDQHVGTQYLKNSQELVGGWAEISMKGHVSYHDVNLSDFDKNQSTWRAMPAVMIRKVALVQLIREVLPEEFSGIYTEEEIPIRVVTDHGDTDNVKVLREKIAELGGEKYAKTAKEMKDLDALNSLYESLKQQSKE